jgi:hypothetical protein
MASIAGAGGLCSGIDRLHLGKTQIYLVFHSIFTIFAGEESYKTRKDMTAISQKKYTADDFAGIWDDENYMAAEDINKAIRDARHVKSSRDEIWDKR